MASWGSVTVVSADPFVADVLSTALYVMGPEAGLEWSAGLEDVGVLYLVGTGDRLRVLHNDAMKRWFGGAAGVVGPVDPMTPERP